VSVLGDRRHGGVFAAPRPEGPWERLGPGLEGREVLALAVAGGTVVAGTDDGIYLWTGARPAETAPAPAAVSLASEASWTRLRTVVRGVDVHPRATDVVALAGTGGLTIAAATAQGLLRSDDGGATWRQPLLGMTGRVSALAAASGRPGVLIAATALGFYVSEDGGQRWTQASPGVEGLEPRGLTILPGSDRVVFATTHRGLFRSTDQGRTWARCTGGVPSTDITALAAHPDGHTLYVTEFGSGGIFRSQDAGESWSRLPSDGLITERAWTVGLDPRGAERVLVASPSGGLHLFAAPSAGAASTGSR
jgi:photosystem II stability/assembly factor-like uncharacterized protein